MPVSEQGVTRDRFMVIPRTLIFLRRGTSYLLLKGAPTKRLWADRYNGIGGHIERSEDVLSAARRELLEETGLSADMWLAGTLLVDTQQNIGICVFVLTGECNSGEPLPSKEGLAEWVSFAEVEQLPVVPDVPVLLARLHGMKRGDPPFSARSYYDEQEVLQVIFSQ